MDTEGMDYQTELGKNYDIVTILPHTIIAENVFLVVGDRLNPREISELIQRLASAAEKVKGSFGHREGKLFGKLVVVVNKCQDISKSDEETLEDLKEGDYFLKQGVEIVLGEPNLRPTTLLLSQKLTYTFVMVQTLFFCRPFNGITKTNRISVQRVSLLTMK